MVINVAEVYCNKTHQNL